MSLPLPKEKSSKKRQTIYFSGLEETTDPKVYFVNQDKQNIFRVKHFCPKFAVLKLLLECLVNNIRITSLIGMWWLKSAKQGLTVRPIAVYLFQPVVAFSSSPRRSVKLNFEEYSSKKVRKDSIP